MLRVVLFGLACLCCCGKQPVADESAVAMGAGAAMDWSGWVPEPPPSPSEGAPSRFIVSVVTDRETFELIGYSIQEVWTSPEGRRVPRFQHDNHEMNLYVSHSRLRVTADVSIRQDHAEVTNPDGRFDIEMSVSFTSRQGKTVSFDWHGHRSLATQQTISREGIDVVIVPRPD